MTEDTSLDFELLSDYLAGVASPAQRAVVEAWIGEASDRQAWVARAQSVWRANDVDAVPPLDFRAFRAELGRRTGISALEGPVAAEKTTEKTSVQPAVVGLQSDTARASMTPPAQGSRTGRWAQQPRRMAITLTAAAIAGCLMLGAAWQAGIARANRALGAYQSVYTTANGERATVRLPDGSTALLSVGSRLEVPADFAVGNRTISLTGEAYFTVNHQAKSPFTVVAGVSTTRVLGTRFVVRHYPTDTAALIAVEDGRVAVGRAVLAAQQEISVSEHGASSVATASRSRFALNRGVLMLDSRPLRDVIPDLNRWFNADVRIADPELQTRELVGEYGAGTVANLAEILELTFNVHVVRSGRTLTLYSRS
jgi:transmembrane sensor